MRSGPISGFATPRLYEFCESEENKLQYVIGLSRNPRLQRMVEPMLESTRLRFDEFEEKQRQFDEFLYRAGSWDRFRPSSSKSKSTIGGSIVALWSPTETISLPSPFMITTLIEEVGNFIKAFKNHLRWIG